MQLREFSYWEERAPGQEWEIAGLVFGQFNLIVGRNATGKTRLLRAIARAAANDSGEIKSFVGSARIHCVFPDVRENPEFPEGKHATPEEVARFRKESNARWGRRLQYLPFGGKMNLKIHKADGEVLRIDLAEAYRRGEERFGADLSLRILKAMDQVGYPIKEITVREWKGGWTIGVKETNRTVITEVRRLSQGVQRMFTLVTFLTLLELEDHAITVLIDDFGEGLDFEHAGRAAIFLISKAGSTKLQFIVATNDRYVMNAVPLEHWTVLVEEGNRTHVFNYANSKAKFDEFKFTGLNNFDFFSMDFGSSGA